MQNYLINLDRSADRLAAFNERNADVLSVHRFAAVDGRTVARAELLQTGLFMPGVTYTDGAVGATLSHLSLWDMAIARNEPLTIIEDDAIFNCNFTAQSQHLLNSIGDDWHIFLWGYNFDSPLLIRTTPHISPFCISFSQDELRKNFEAFCSADLQPRPFKLVQGSGLVCYSISPAGARLFKRFCTPIRKMQIYFRALNRVVQNHGLDIMMNAIYVQANCYACFPPLVVTPNDHAVSLSQRPRTASGQP